MIYDGFYFIFDKIYDGFLSIDDSIKLFYIVYTSSFNSILNHFKNLNSYQSCILYTKQSSSLNCPPLTQELLDEITRVPYSLIKVMNTNSVLKFNIVKTFKKSLPSI